MAKDSAERTRYDGPKKQVHKTVTNVRFDNHSGSSLPNYSLNDLGTYASTIDLSYKTPFGVLNIKTSSNETSFNTTGDRPLVKRNKLSVNAAFILRSKIEAGNAFWTSTVRWGCLYAFSTTSSKVEINGEADDI
uniref:Uncharacterized protein n=1 Tax=Romanomermis culicivorax TaxID=13658 RepID=A0A915IIM4_ROMCU